MQNPNYQAVTDEQKQFSLPADSLAGRVIMISGATGGMGTCLSRACASAGATVVVAGRKIKKLEKLYDVLDDIGPAQPAMIPLEQDKAGPAEYIEITDMLEKEFGKIDALIHASADLGSPTPQMGIEHSEWVRVMNVNLTSARLLSLYCMPLLSQSDMGSLSFLLDHKPTAYSGAYGVSKQALQAFMHMLADEHENHRDAQGNPIVAINGYDPGPMRTQLRRHAFPGELEGESETPDKRLGPLLSLMVRTDRSVNGVALAMDAKA
ncbi:SDR family NAD(P)-dependent oxidoreductase [Granulosicoccus antarcticus]|uniref:Putative oxidoreductase YciK n=1 Tax=Granulosicoccus antarcticus IMCC3135 TaxID=1192854 RepID=A0A2Z2NUI7_9GAMM|nr:SDR family NAD(P)-dependent oxidoreductase [Granulosicoccus antarcticus]ASJ75232.1 putative oxidoreductase YciK [Granulosicoccus antarcticus IMCC3135]